jgi:hypothetical protein
MSLQIRGIPEDRLKECKKRIDERGDSIILLDRAMPLALREALDVVDAYEAIRHL